MVSSLFGAVLNLTQTRKTVGVRDSLLCPWNLIVEPKQLHSRIVYFIPVTCQTLCQLGKVKMRKIL